MAENFLVTGRDRYSLETIGKSISDRGDNHMEWAVMPDELRPVTIDDVISPAPMNPSCMSLSCRFQTEARTDLERSSKEIRPYLSAFYPTKGEGCHLADRRVCLPLRVLAKFLPISRVIWSGIQTANTKRFQGKSSRCHPL